MSGKGTKILIFLLIIIIIAAGAILGAKIMKDKQNAETYSGGAFYVDGSGKYHEVDTQAEWEACSNGGLNCQDYGGGTHTAINYNVLNNTDLKNSNITVRAYDGYCRYKMVRL